MTEAPARDQMRRAERLSISMAADIGGTFTDVVLEARANRFSTKILTTHAAPEQGVLEGIKKILSLARVAPTEVGRFVHGTTLATNALIERRGARTALLTTEGFRDVLEIRAEDRYEQYDLGIDLPKPLVPRKWRFTVPERIDAHGDVRIPLDEAQVERLADDLQAAGIESLAIGFLHSYRFAAHEERARDLLLKKLPDLWITLSSEVAPEMREYERFSTAVANAYVQPLMAGYLTRLQDTLRQEGFVCTPEMMLSGGGLTTVETSCKYPVRLVESGPAGGAIFSAFIARQCVLGRVVSYDMGGTTAKISLIDDGQAMRSRSFEVARVYRFKRGSGLPLRIPVIEMVEIGAGGGSIAEVDRLGRVSVGPESAGSEPGPACYGRGGHRPTVTDADLVLGRIDPDAFAGGTMRLDVKRSCEAVAEHIGAPQKLSDEMAAWAITEIVEENMASAARVHAIESGAELAGRTLVAFGGAAPLHALRMAEKLGIDRVIIPSAAGVGSAVGFLKAPISFEIVRSLHVRLSRIDLNVVDKMLRALSLEARQIVAYAKEDAQFSESRAVYMRYAGQGHEIAVQLPSGNLTNFGAEKLREAFEQEYRRTYGRLVANVDLEFLSWSVTVTAIRQAAEHPPATLVPRNPPVEGLRKLYDSKAGCLIDVPTYRRERLNPGDRISGPAVIVEDETSTLVTPAFVATVNGWGYLDCEKVRP